MQRQQHQAEPDRDPADILDPRARAAAERNETDDEQDGRGRGDVERQHLNDQRGADIGAEHDRERRHQADQPFGGKGTRDQGGRGAALQQRGQAEARDKGGEAVVERLRQQQAQIGAERAQNSAVDHVQAPQQQRHAAHQVEKNQASHARPIPALQIDGSGYRQTTADQSFYSRACVQEMRRRAPRMTSVNVVSHATHSTSEAALKAANPRARSALRSSTSSSPICSRSVGPPGAQLVAVR